MQKQEEKVDIREVVDAGLVVIESSGTKHDKQDTSSSSGNYTTQAVDADIRPVNDDEPFAEVQLTALHNILANEQQHTEQSEPILFVKTLSLLVAAKICSVWDSQVVSEPVRNSENHPISITTDTQGQIKILPPRTVEEIQAKERERKARTTLLMALPEDHLAKFHKMTDAKEMWDAIKSRFGGNDKSKKMQNLLSQLEIHGASVSTEDANQKFLRSLPSAWSQVSLIMRTKPGMDSLNFDDLYNNLRVFENDVKGPTASSSSTQNVEFVSENTSSTNEVSTAYGASSSSGHNPQRESSSSYADELTYSFFANQSSVAMISMRLKVSSQKDRSKGNQDSRRRDAWNTWNKAIKNGRRSGKQEEPKALVTLDEDSQMSARDKAGLGYGEQMNKGVLSYENEVFGSLFYSRYSDIEDSLVSDRYAEGMHAVPPLMIGIYIPSGPDKEIDESQFTYDPKQSKPSKSDARSSDFNSCESNSSEETNESIPKPVANEPKAVSDPKVWSDAPIIEEYESDSDDEHVSLPIKNRKHLPDLFKDCDFHEKRMAKQAELNKRMCKGTGQREYRPVWNNVQRVNHQNQFVPTALLTRTGRIQVNTARASSTNNVNTARHNFNSQAVPTNAARKVHTVKPIVNNVRPKTVFHKTHSPIRRPFNRTTAPRTNFSNQKVNTAEVNAVSAVGGKRETAIKPSADYPQRALKNKGIVDSGCSRHMTGNKAYLAEYQDYNGGLVLFGVTTYCTCQMVLLTSTVKSSEAKNKGEKPNKNTNLKTNEKPVDQEDQYFLDELERLKRQEKEAKMHAKALKRSLPKILRICFFKQELLELANHVTTSEDQMHGIVLPPPFILSPTRPDAPSLGIPPPLPILVPTSSPPLLLPSATRREDKPEVT
ncbi:hypothetical protein Tco_0635889, partial [Tanacetum coccineum]